MHDPAASDLKAGGRSATAIIMYYVRLEYSSLKKGNLTTNQH